MSRLARIAFLLLGGIVWLSSASARADEPLPRFTEEREAAALFFVKKQLPDLMPILDQLKQTSTIQYQHEIREIFSVTEMLADLVDEPRRYDLELKIWKTENRANMLVVRLSTPDADARKNLETQLLDIAKELVDLDIQVLELKAEQLDKELGEVNDDLARLKRSPDKETKDRYDGLIEKASKRSKK